MNDNPLAYSTCSEAHDHIGGEEPEHSVVLSGGAYFEVDRAGRHIKALVAFVDINRVHLQHKKAADERRWSDG